jgi:hypothetical protein
VREIAARWEITEKAAESILFRARREFRVKMQTRMQPEEHLPLEPSRNGKRPHPVDSTSQETATADDAVTS